MKNAKILTKLLALSLVVLMAVTALAGCKDAITKSNKEKVNATQENTITITVKVIAADESEKTFTIETDKKYLGAALYDEGLVTKEEFESGFYTYIDGVRADYTEDKCWWCFTKGGENVMVSANELEIADGDTFEITNTPA